MVVPAGDCGEVRVGAFGLDGWSLQRTGVGGGGVSGCRSAG